MTKEEKKANLQAKIKDILTLAKEKKIDISAIQQITPEGYINTVVLWRDTEVYPETPTEPKITDAEAKDGTIDGSAL